MRRLEREESFFWLLGLAASGLCTRGSMLESWVSRGIWKGGSSPYLGLSGSEF